MDRPELWQSPQGPLLLRRYPSDVPDNLQAWDAADEYLLRHLDEQKISLAGTRALVLNDTFGALAVALARAGAQVSSWNDSLLAERALVQNMQDDGLSPGAAFFIPGDKVLHQNYDLVLIKLPRQLDWLQDTLLRLRPSLSPQTRILAGGMIKHTPRRAYLLLEKCIGPTTTSLGWKKARLALANFDPDKDCPAQGQATTLPLPDLRLVLTSGPNVFSRDKLDGGTRLLLRHVPTLEPGARILDLGCGNGVLALAAARLNPEALVRGTDISYQAVASARTNARRNELGHLWFEVAENASELLAGSIDLVLCNPPFHQDRIVGDHLARRMLADALRVLKPGGELRMVGNRHLGYPRRLTELFGGCALLQEDRRFQVLSAVKE